MTALFADIKGSTELTRDLDPEEAQAIVDPALKLMIDAVRQYDGYVVQSTGDGIFALFGAPQAHEDHPQRALYAAIRMQKALIDHVQRLAAQGKPALGVRVGVNSGEVVMRTVETGGRLEYTPVGNMSNIAARMQTISRAGGIVISGDTRRLVEGYFELRGLGPTTVKGIAEPIDIYEVVGAGPLRSHFELAARRGLTKFVGREREIAEMKSALELARSGHGQILAVVGEPGTGKSRLFYEFKATLPAECKLLEAYTLSHAKASAWLPVLELLRSYFVIHDADDAEERREKIRAKLLSLEPALADVLPYMLALLDVPDVADPLAGMDGQIKQLRTLDSIKRIVLGESQEQAVMLIFEDLHWIDEQTQALLDLLSRSIANARVLLLVNYRPEYRHDWANLNHYVQLSLNPLIGKNAETMLAALLGEGVELAPLKRLVIERTEGNPFFIEEMLQALFDEGVLVRNGAVKMTRSLSQLRLPPTVQGILAARIDRLSATQKELLQTLAVIGRESKLNLIRKLVSTTNPSLEAMLAELAAADFIYERPAGTDIECVFKHALTQEVAYSSLLIKRRRVLHQRAGEELESISGGHLDDHLSELAYHYRNSDNVSKAIEYLGRAGQQALQRSAHAVAIYSLNTAIDLLQRLPDGRERIRRELFLQLALGSALIAVKGWPAPEVERAFTRARELCQQLGGLTELFPALFGLWSVHYFRGELQTAYELAEQLLEHAQGMRAPKLLARQATGATLFEMGEFSMAKQHFERAILSDDHGSRRPRVFRYGGIDAGVVGLSYRAWILWLLGYPDQALKRGDEALTLARALSHPQSLVFGEYFFGVLCQYRREVPPAQEAAETVTALAGEHGFSFWSAIGVLLSGWTIAHRGRTEEGIARIQTGLAAFRALGAKAMLPQFLSWLAEACRQGSRLDEALRALTEALAAANEHDDRCYEAEIHRLRGEVLLRQDDSNTAEPYLCFERAIEITRKQGAKSLELRATMSVARLLAKHGRRHEACSMLAEIYNSFTEGLDTADLKDAKGLLEEVDG